MASARRHGSRSFAPRAGLRPVWPPVRRAPRRSGCLSASRRRGAACRRARRRPCLRELGRARASARRARRNRIPSTRIKKETDMNYYELLLCLLFFPLANRLRGGGFFANYLPGRPLFWVSAAVGAFMGALTADWRAGVMWALGYLFWGIPAWGRWFTLGRGDRSGKPDWFERIVEVVGGENDHICFTIRHFLIAPLVIGLSVYTASIYTILIGLLFPPMAVVSYEIGWRYVNINGGDPIEISEIISGFAFALLAVAFLLSS